jgi:hypothetical protein
MLAIWALRAPMTAVSGGQRAHHHRVGTGDHWWLAQVLGAQRGLDLFGPPARVTPPGTGQRTPDPRTRQPGRGRRVRRGGQ